MSSITIQQKGILDIPADAIVNAANSGLLAGGGVCGVIFQRAGERQLAAACKEIGHCPEGSAVITAGFGCPCKYIIHAVGPVYRDGTRGRRSSCMGPTNHPSSCVAIVELEYDSAGNVTRQEHYGVDGQLNSDGVAIVEFEYDSAGNRIREECYGVDGQLTLNSYGVAIVESEYDGAGNMIRLEHYGVDGRLVADSNGVAIIENEYDSAGNVVETRLYDDNGRRVE